MPNRQDRKGRSKTEGAYMNLPHIKVNHASWRSLNGGAIKVYIELHSRFKGSNNGKLCLSFDEAARLLNLSKSTVNRAFKELEEKGFIVKTRQGHWYGRMATEWRLTDQSFDGHLSTRDWQNWPPEPKPKTNPRYCGGTYSTADGAVSVPKP